MAQVVCLALVQGLVGGNGYGVRAQGGISGAERGSNMMGLSGNRIQQ